MTRRAPSLKTGILWAAAVVVAAGAASETRLAGAVVVEAAGAVVDVDVEAVVVVDVEVDVDVESTSPRALTRPVLELASLTSPSVDSTDSPLARAMVIACCFGYKNSSPIERPG